jgi:hypothetical protein
MDSFTHLKLRTETGNIPITTDLFMTYFGDSTVGTKSSGKQLKNWFGEELNNVFAKMLQNV